MLLNRLVGLCVCVQVKRHVKPRPNAPGGVIAKESPVHYSNVALLDPPTG